ncbi:uncharacterized protein PITG_02866 [Phytophthora infestans T30-4]|uniref:tRNA threonylcarbamoyladenosine biosynthesis protein TsaE n=1 Tax=Phytophthora infestans (strain T30-4) TaxID=403677 RepID=D0MXF0_PHYIT|nr:uncharacterized protein PITG_02866 [Phytophthora infestans T30-4]EEY64313.1 conserved hypothetical protein [Phytophthora infestans T30-4]|eukprot:XP_002907749.1 conserved hypothetical protein [Phytophthora infestans T30-4]
MEKLGEWLARDRQAGDVLFLKGDLGCGKTCLARGFAAQLPTVYHVDLYRLDAVTEQDAAALGLADAFDRGITLVEWPERFEETSVPPERLDVRISYDEEDPEIRHVEMLPVGERWTKFFNEDVEA